MLECNWKELRKDEYDKCWNFVYESLNFKPYKGKLLELPEPKLSFNISEFYDEGFQEDLYENFLETSVSWFK